MNREIPFKVGRPVTGPYFVNREEEIEKIEAGVEAGQSLALIAPRKLGKTSVLKEALEKLGDDYLVGMVDCMEIADLEELAKGISREVSKSDPSLLDSLKSVWQGSISKVLKKVKKVGGDIAGILTLFVEFEEEKISERELLKGSLDFIEEYAKDKEKRMVFVFDEVSDLYERDGEILKIMRSKMQNHDNASYIISGSQESTMEYIIKAEESPFYLFFTEVKLKPLPPEGLKDFLEERFSKFGVVSDSEAIDQIVELTKGHPGHTQRLALKAYYLSQESEKLKVQDVNEAFELTLDELSVAFEEKWNKLTRAPLQMKIIKALAKGENPYQAISKEKSSISNQLKTLTQRGYLRKIEKGKFEFLDPLFKEWVAKGLDR